jgi:hypothetical protein
MGILKVETVEDYRDVVQTFLENEKFLIRTVNTVIAEVTQKHPTCTNGLLIPIVSDGRVEFYFKEYVESLLVCTVNIFDMVVVGSKMEEKDRKRYLKMLYGKMDFVKDQEKQTAKKRKARKDWWFLSKKKIEEYDSTLEGLAVAKIQINEYIRYLEDREEIMQDITNDIVGILKESEHLNYVRFSKEYEYITPTVE